MGALLLRTGRRVVAIMGWWGRGGTLAVWELAEVLAAEERPGQLDHAGSEERPEPGDAVPGEVSSLASPRSR
jgi:hypothetical protein